MFITLPTKIALLIRVSIHEKETLFVAESPDIVGLLVTARALDDLLERTPGAIAEMLKFMGQECTVTPALHPEKDGYRYFVAMPMTEAAR